VQSPKCGNGNEPLDKVGAITVLGLVLDRLALVLALVLGLVLDRLALVLGLVLGLVLDQRRRRASGSAPARRPLLTVAAPPGGSRAARAPAVTTYAPSTGSRAVAVTRTTTVPDRPDGSRSVAQDCSRAPLRSVIRRAAAHGWPATPMPAAAASAARSAAASTR